VIAARGLLVLALRGRIVGLRMRVAVTVAVVLGGALSVAASNQSSPRGASAVRSAVASPPTAPHRQPTLKTVADMLWNIGARGAYVYG